MPFARVGAMPQPVPNNKQRNMQRSGDGGVAGRQKGITMEDLKKQTAIRLAQEQQQPVRYAGGVDQARDPPLRPLSEHQIHEYSRPAYQQRNAYPDHASSYQSQESFKILKNSYHQPVYQQPYHEQNFPQQYQPRQQPLDYNRENLRNHNTNNYRETLQAYPRNQAPLPSHGTGHVMQLGNRAPANVRYEQEQVPRYQQGPSNSNHLSIPRRANNDLPTLQSTAMPNSKLPHGLTVHELKEMTKARLQAEALIDRHAPEGRRDPSTADRRTSPLDVDSLSERRDRAMSRDSASRTNHVGLNQGVSSDSMQSIPSLVHVSQGSRDSNPGRQPQVSPLPPGFMNFASAGQNLPTTGVSQQKVPVPAPDGWLAQPRPETWETASSASQNSAVLSENLGSESAFSAGFAGAKTQPDSLHLPRGRSYTYPAAPYPSGRDLLRKEEKAPPSPNLVNQNGAAYFAPAIGANRRRACTMSPKPGSIHEDRPHLSGEELAIPSFSSTDHNTFLIRSRKNSYSPVLSQLGLEKLSVSNGSGHLDSSSRPRASSATSLPQLYSGAEDFPFEQSSSLGTNTFGQHNPSAPGSRERARSEDVYRERNFSSGRVPAPPPGFGKGNTVAGGQSLDYYPAFSPVDRAENGVASGSENNIFGAMGIDANNMGSILQLSGDRPDRERSNTYPSVSQKSTEAFFTENFFGKNPESFP